eukprot:g14988.t1
MVPHASLLSPPLLLQPLNKLILSDTSRTADHLLGRNGGVSGGDTGIFGEISHTPGGSPWFSSKRRRDTRRAILLKLTCLNLFLALILIIVGGAGPQYPGHSGTTNNPVPNWVDRAGAAATLLTSVASALTCLGSFAVVMLDINYIAGCCSLLEDNCEVSNLCTQFVDDCCIGNDVEDYCGNPSYHIGAVSMIFLVFVSTMSMVIMASTITCRCWLDSDPERQAMLMVLTGSPYSSPMGSTLPESPRFSPRNTLLSALGFGDTSSSGGGALTKRPSLNQPLSEKGEGTEAVANRVVDGAVQAHGVDLEDGMTTHSAAAQRDAALREANRVHCRQTRERKRNQERRLREEVVLLQLCQSIVESGPDLFSLHGLNPNAPFSFLCKGFSRQLQIEPEDILGQPLSSIVDLRDTGVLQSVVLHVLGGGGGGESAAPAVAAGGNNSRAGGAGSSASPWPSADSTHTDSFFNGIMNQQHQQHLQQPVVNNNGAASGGSPAASRSPAASLHTAIDSCFHDTGGALHLHQQQAGPVNSKGGGGPGGGGCLVNVRLARSGLRCYAGMSIAIGSQGLIVVTRLYLP